MTWWRMIESEVAGELALAAEPADRIELADDARLDEVALAFADIIDAKSPFTFRHSTRVAAFARDIGPRPRRRRGGTTSHPPRGLLHDIGKLGVSSRILDKNGGSRRKSGRRSNGIRRTPTRFCRA
jgi:HD-GYP domain-containing protein (c-di-GMP phosphodiesterase class II)